MGLDSAAPSLLISALRRGALHMKIAVESVEVATLKSDGRSWDGPSAAARVPRDQLAEFFALDLDGQLGRLVQAGPAPTPPDLMVRVFSGDTLLLETNE